MTAQRMRPGCHGRRSNGQTQAGLRRRKDCKVGFERLPNWMWCVSREYLRVMT